MKKGCKFLKARKTNSKIKPIDKEVFTLPLKIIKADHFSVRNLIDYVYF